MSLSAVRREWFETDQVRLNAEQVALGARENPMRVSTSNDDSGAEFSKGDDDRRGCPSTATQLVELAQRNYSLGVSTLDEPYAVPLCGVRLVTMLRGGGRTSLRAKLAREYYRGSSRAAPQQALAEALLVIEGMARDNEPIELHQRVARYKGGLYVDVGDAAGRIIMINPDKWTIVNHAPMLFRRTALTAALPTPVRGGDFAGLWKVINVGEADQPLVLAWLVAALMPDIPHPVLSLQGEQGSAKTSAMRALVSLIDPSPVPTRKPPRDGEAWITAAAGSWVVGLDNVSAVPDWLSDSLCRAVTGDGDVRRKLYTDGEHAVFAFRRVIVVTSIDLGSIRGDLAERMLPITLQPIDEARRVSDAAMTGAWVREHAGVLGALFDLSVEVLRWLPKIELLMLPRMADYAQILAAVDRVMGTNGFQEYLMRQGTVARDTLSADPLISAIMRAGGIVGTAADIYQRLTPQRPPRDWPPNARAVTQRLRRHAPAMRRVGWGITDDGGRNVANVLRWSVTVPEATCS